MDNVLLNNIKQHCSSLRAFTLTAGEDEFFGPNREVHVTTIIMNDELRQLHKSLVGMLSDVGAIFDEPEYMLENYRAHATVQESTRLHNGDVATIDSITIIDKLPRGNPNNRKLLKTLKLSK